MSGLLKKKLLLGHNIFTFTNTVTLFLTDFLKMSNVMTLNKNK